MLDVGCGQGRTIVPVLRELEACKLHRKIILTLNDISVENAVGAYNTVLPFFTRRRQDIRVISEAEHIAFANADSHNTFDLVISNAVFHHFPATAYVKRLYDILKPGGFLVAGDFHTTIWQHPSSVTHFLGELGADKAHLKKFHELTGTGGIEEFNKKRSAEELRANEEMVRYWRELQAIVFRSQLKGAPCLEAHESSAQRIEKLRSGGFITDYPQMFGHFHPEIKPLLDKMATTQQEQRIAAGRQILRIIKEKPTAELLRVRRRIHRGSDIARVIVAQKPLPRA